MTNNRILKVTLEWNAEDRRKRDELREQYMNGMRKNMISKDLRGEDEENKDL